MVDVFISYSRNDQAVVARLAEAVKREGYSVWWDAELPPHLSYGDVITEKIGSAKAAIVVWSQTAAASEWVRAEADVARGQKKLIQTSIDDRMPPMPFNQIQFASIGDWAGEADHPGWRKVKASLEALCGPASGGEERPPAAFPAAARPAPLATPVPAKAGRSGLLAILLLLLVLLGAALAYLLFFKDEGSKVREVREATEVREVTDAPARRAEPSPAPRAEPTKQADRFGLRAVIDDPDGYTNVRAGPSGRSAIVDRVEDGETFVTFRQTGAWWRVRTSDGTLGYMSASRIRLLRE
jgi:hypothetical protein